MLHAELSTRSLKDSPRNPHPKALHQFLRGMLRIGCAYASVSGRPFA